MKYSQLLSSHHATVSSGNETSVESTVIWQVFLSQGLGFQNCFCLSVPPSPQMSLDGDREKKTALRIYHTSEIIAVEQSGSEGQLLSLFSATAVGNIHLSVSKQKEVAAAQLSLP